MGRLFSKDMFFLLFFQYSIFVCMFSTDFRIYLSKLLLLESLSERLRTSCSISKLTSINSINSGNNNHYYKNTFNTETYNFPLNKFSPKIVPKIICPHSKLFRT